MRVYTHRSRNMAWAWVMRDPADGLHYVVPRDAGGWANRRYYAGRLDNLQPVGADLLPGILRQVGAPEAAAA